MTTEIKDGKLITTHQSGVVTVLEVEAIQADADFIQDEIERLNRKLLKANLTISEMKQE